jgi:hypothetical protein
MARFGRSFVQAATQPQYAQGLFTAAQQMGAAPGRRRAEAEAERKRKEEEAKLARQREYQAGLLTLGASGEFDPEMLQGALGGAAELGIDPSTAAQLISSGRQMAPKGLTAAQERELSKNFTVNSIQNYKQTSNISDLVRLTEQGDRFKVVGNNIFDTKTQSYIQPSEAADQLTPTQLKDVVTNKSFVEYLQTGDENVLVAKGEKEDEKRLTPAEISAKLSKADSVIDVIAKAREADVWGGTFDVAKFIPLTDARSLSGYIKTLKGNLAFDELKQMREESKTGGALGQVSNIELGLLESAVAALDPATPETFYENLKVVEEKYTNFRNALLGKPPVGEQWRQMDGVIYYKQDKNDDTSWVVVTGE